MTRRASDRGWWSVRVELIGGGNAGELWPRPGRLFVVSEAHTFHVFAEAIDDAFARWDRSHLHEFTLPDGRRVTEFRYIEDIDPDRELDADTLTLGELLQAGDEFGYTFDLGDNWRHRCRVDGQDLDPRRVLGTVPDRPLPYWGWGVIPDAYGRLFDGDDGQTPIPDPDEPWPWANAPEPSIVTWHHPGHYTRTRNHATDRYNE
ncbi:plasmid pRiA4b ORF-3 family protein [Paractinoplanes rishiriensis]|uniref:plasmid pRiA4b ORF-3 family protein n=1 Tax=Paractinoplanes rishiriensis TaxID=1050105 RepID=UPI001EF287BF|nr:plasmid pRiA4b ORF-3 family protein [Actinoplanes rishiriensis]